MPNLPLKIKLSNSTISPSTWLDSNLKRHSNRNGMNVNKREKMLCHVAVNTLDPQEIYYIRAYSRVDKLLWIAHEFCWALAKIDEIRWLPMKMSFTKCILNNGIAGQKVKGVCFYLPFACMYFPEKMNWLIMLVIFGNHHGIHSMWNGCWFGKKGKCWNVSRNVLFVCCQFILYNAKVFVNQLNWVSCWFYCFTKF